MDDLMIASSEADARAAAAVEQHHAQMAGALAVRADALAAAARTGHEVDGVRWCRTELVPHALAEESTMYRAAGAMVEGRLLVEAMLVEHQRIVGLVEALEETTDPVTGATLARALQELFEAHLAKENDQVLPLLVGSPGVSVADLLGGMHELLGGHADHGAHPADAATAPGQGGCGGEGHTCSCGEVDGTEMPELDARSIPHAIRHATIFGALEGVRPGAGLVLVAPHDPVPLLEQLEQREPGRFAVDYLERGPEAWRLALVRRPS
jgi:uncharacterized protein (DUF2249 family)